MWLILSEQASLVRSAWIHVTDDTGEIFAEFDNADSFNAWLAENEMVLIDPLGGKPGYVRLSFLEVDQHALEGQPFSVEGA